MKFDLPEHELRLLEGVDYGLEMALINQEGRGYMGLVHCKDYITDVFWSEFTGKDIGNIYGFCWKAGTMPIAVPEHRILLHHKGELAPKGARLQSFLRFWDECLGIDTPSRVLTFSDQPEYLVVRFSNKWAEKPSLGSLLTLWLRVGLSYDPDTDISTYLRAVKETKTQLLRPRDNEYVYRATPLLSRIMSGKCPKLRDYVAFSTANKIHNYGGIVEETRFIEGNNA